MSHQPPRIHGTLPIVLAISTFLLGLVKLQPGITFVDSGDSSLTRPLETDTFYIFTTSGICQYRINKRLIRTFHRAEHNIHSLNLHGRPEIITDKISQRSRCPTTTREYLRRVELVLGHYGKDWNSVFLIGLDKFREIEGIGFQVKRVLDKHIRTFMADLIGRQTISILLVIILTRIGRGIVFVIFHPSGRAPRGSPQA